MPIEEDHPVLKLPKGNISLWRYMDIPALLSMLANNSLAFIRADLFEDKYEGTLPKITAENLDFKTRKEIEEGKTDEIYWNFSEIINKNNGYTYINCWCRENHEMVHMWKIYSKENGIAIQTDYDKLKKSILSTESVYPTEIKYLDFKNDEIKWKSNLMTLYTIKRHEYKSEKEFRLLVSHPKLLEDELLKIDFKNRPAERKKLYQKNPAIYCKVNLQELISKIHVSPYAPDWYVIFLKDLLKRYNLENIEIYKSDI